MLERCAPSVTSWTCVGLSSGRAGRAPRRDARREYGRILALGTAIRGFGSGRPNVYLPLCFVLLLAFAGPSRAEVQPIDKATRPTAPTSRVSGACLQCWDQDARDDSDRPRMHFNNRVRKRRPRAEDDDSRKAGGGLMAASPESVVPAPPGALGPVDARFAVTRHPRPERCRILRC